MNNNCKRFLTITIVSSIAVFSWSIANICPLQALETKGLSIERENFLLTGNISLPAPDNSVINGLFTPNSSELFFREGREKLDLEIQILLDRDLAISKNLLEIQEDIFKQQQELENNSQIELTPSKIDLQ